MKNQTKKFLVIYTFKGGFENSISVDAIDSKQAIEKANNEVIMAYGKRLWKHFIFQQTMLDYQTK